jgi:heptosyltransferase-2
MAEGPRILVIGPRWVGDMVMAQCLLAALKDRFPEAVIDVAAPPSSMPIAARMPEVRGCVATDQSPGRLDLGARIALGRRLAGRYDRAYVLPGSWKSALVPFVAGIAERVGFLRELRFGLLNRIVPLPKARRRRTAEMYHLLAGGGAFRPPRLRIDLDNRAALLARHGLALGAYAALVPGAEYGPAKRWPEAHFAELARNLVGRGLRPVLFGSDRDRTIGEGIRREVPEVLDLLGRTRLEDAVDLLGGAAVAVANDSGLMHVAAAVGAPVVGIYGSTSFENTPPLATARELVSSALPCSPCHRRACPLGHLDCLRGLRPERVAAAVDRLLASPPAPAVP